MGREFIGVGKDADVITNSLGGKQSATYYSYHLIDPEFLFNFIRANNEYDEVLDCITAYMCQDDKEYLYQAVIAIGNNYKVDPLQEIAKVLKEGEEKYGANNWRLIPEESHINHALIHYFAFRQGDNTDNHLQHCLCRLMMGIATRKSKGFHYVPTLTKEDITFDNK